MIKRINMYIIMVFASQMIVPLPASMAKVVSLSDSIPKTDMAYIRWIGEYPSKQKGHSKKSLIERIGNFVFGEKPAVFRKPVAVLAHNPNKYWVLDQNDNSIALIEKEKGISLNPKSKNDQAFHSLVGICELPNKDILVTDSRLNKIFLLTNGGKNMTSLNDSLHLQQPTGIAYSREKNEIWVLETKVHRISILNAEGVLLRTIGIRGSAPGEFNFPTHIWIDRQGLVYIVDSMNFRVQVFDSDGAWISMFGQAGDATGYFARPKGIAVDSHNNIYVVDALFHTIQIFNKEGVFLYNFGKQGHGNGDFWMPLGIYIDDNDNIFVADSYNSRVQIFQLINYK